jgi:hypothetical protein
MLRRLLTWLLFPFFFLSSLASSQAEASESGRAGESCPWTEDARVVSIVGNDVYVDGELYELRRGQRRRLERDMRSCGVDEVALHQLHDWQRQRRGAWITGTVGAVFLWPLWVVTGVQIHDAVHSREALERGLEGRSPLFAD